MFGGDFFSVIGLGIVAVLAFLAVIALAIVAVATGRSDPDPEGRRAYAFYLAVVGVITILVTLFAFNDAAGNVITSIVEEDAEAFHDEFGFEDESFSEESEFSFETESEFSAPDPDDQRYTNAVRSGLAAAVAFGIYWFHRRRFSDLHLESVGKSGGAWRVHYGYLLAVAFVGIAVVLVSVSDGLYGVVRALLPDFTGFDGDDSVERRAGLAQLLRGAVLAGTAALVFLNHWRRSQAIATPPPPEPPMPAVPPTDPSVSPSGAEARSPATPPS
ncbi:MAG TPA: hypothetical protein VI916_03610 [Acidimicrobiia bacterium]|nr:hypothetical protein [Acidimicrobiia bacterium]